MSRPPPLSNLLHALTEFGPSVIHEPATGEPVIDIVIVHGLQGHPYKTWAWVQSSQNDAPPAANPHGPSVEREGGSATKFRRIIPRITRKLTRGDSRDVASVIPTEDDRSAQPKGPPIFWPADLLPSDCPLSRIIMYGYDTRVSNYLKAPTNLNGVFHHGKDFLSELAGVRQSNRPLVFVAHSLGGIVTKEMLARSAASTEGHLRNIVESTAAVIFLGTPHRGSPGLTTLGQWASSFVSVALRMKTNTAILDALGLKNTDLERAQDAFSEIWNKYDFRVKTFQEGLGLTGVNIGALGSKVVPDESSKLGDARECAETIQANHMDMCRFRSKDDPGYRKVSRVIKSVYESHIKLNPQSAHLDGNIAWPLVQVNGTSGTELLGRKGLESSPTDLARLESLRYPGMNTRLHSIERGAAGTCLWPMGNEIYKNWIEYQHQDHAHGMVWLKGNPGTGKSTVMKAAFELALQQQPNSGYCTAAFFFGAQGSALGNSALGLFQCLLFQLLPQYPEHLRRFSSEYGDLTEAKPEYTEPQLRSFFRSMFESTTQQRTIVYIDALDECDENTILSQALFWRDITLTANQTAPRLSVCISSRYHPSITLKNCPEIPIEVHNSKDIAKYIDWKLSLGFLGDIEEEKFIREMLIEKAAGVFLWVVLVTDAIFQKKNEGASLLDLLDHLSAVPEKLDDLFTQMLQKIDPDKRDLTLRLFQWAILATKPLRLFEWHHILAFIQDEPPLSLKEFGDADTRLEDIRQGGALPEELQQHHSRKRELFARTNDELERRIRFLSKGLIEVKTRFITAGERPFEQVSDCAGAGSLDLEQGDTRAVHVIHESVRDYFCQGKGFYVLQPNLRPSSAIGEGHISIMSTCLKYIKITELDALVSARSRVTQTDHGHEEMAQDAEIQSALDFAPFDGPFDAPGYWGQMVGSSAVSVASFCSASSYDTGQYWRDTSKQHGYEHPVTYETPSSRKRKALQSPSPPRDGKKILKRDSVLESLCKPAVASAPAVEIERWIPTGKTTDILADLFARHSPAPFSVTGRSQIVEAFPALLSYATSRMFQHAFLGQNSGADPSDILNCLQEGSTWRRWVALKEDIPYDTGLLYYAAARSLSSWVRTLNRRDISKIAIDAILESLKRNDERAAEVLFAELGYDASYEDNKQGPLLHMLTIKNNISYLRLFLKYVKVWDEQRAKLQKPHINIDLEDNRGQTALHVALENRNSAAAFELLTHGASVQASGYRGRQALHIICYSKPYAGSYNIVKQDGENSPLATRCDLVKLLLGHGADVNGCDRKGRTPLHAICYSGICPKCKVQNDSVLGYELTTEDRGVCPLRSRTTKISSDTNQDPASISLLTSTSQRTECDCKLHVVSELLNRGARVDVVGGDLETPLHMACFWPDREVVSELLRHGANPKSADTKCRIPLHLGAWFADSGVVEELLLQPGQDVNTIDYDGETALQMACYPRSMANQQGRGIRIIDTLLQFGAKAFTIKNGKGHSAHDIAEHFLFYDAVKLLRSRACDSPYKSDTVGNK